MRRSSKQRFIAMIRGEFKIDKPTPMFDSFEEYFEDFLSLGED